jgi:hypothetical protein
MPAAVVHRVVVPDAEGQQVGEIGRPAALPPQHVVRFAALVRDAAAIDRAGRVHDSERTSLGSVGETTGSSEVEPSAPGDVGHDSIGAERDLDVPSSWGARQAADGVERELEAGRPAVVDDRVGMLTAPQRALVDHDDELGSPPTAGRLLGRHGSAWGGSSGSIAARSTAGRTSAVRIASTRRTTA